MHSTDLNEQRCIAQVYNAYGYILQAMLSLWLVPYSDIIRNSSALLVHSIVADTSLAISLRLQSNIPFSVFELRLVVEEVAEIRELNSGQYSSQFVLHISHDTLVYSVSTVYKRSMTIYKERHCTATIQTIILSDSHWPYGLYRILMLFAIV